MGEGSGIGRGLRSRVARLLLGVADALERRSLGAGPVPEVSVGPRVTIGPDVRFVADASGPPDRVDLGGDAWIGRGSHVFGGVSIGPGAVVRPYSVVMHDVRPFAVVVGNPAVEVARRFDDATIAALLEVAWWDWTDAEVAERTEALHSSDARAALEQLREG